MKTAHKRSLILVLILNLAMPLSPAWAINSTTLPIGTGTNNQPEVPVGNNGLSQEQASAIDSATGFTTNYIDSSRPDGGDLATVFSTAPITPQAAAGIRQSTREESASPETGRVIMGGEIAGPARSAAPNDSGPLRALPTRDRIRPPRGVVVFDNPAQMNELAGDAQFDGMRDFMPKAQKVFGKAERFNVTDSTTEFLMNRSLMPSADYPIDPLKDRHQQEQLSVLTNPEALFSNAKPAEDAEEIIVVDMIDFTQNIQMVYRLLNPPKRLHPWLKYLLYSSRLSPEMLELYLKALEGRDRIYRRAADSNGKYKIRYQGKVLDVPVFVWPDQAFGRYELVEVRKAGTASLVTPAAPILPAPSTPIS